MTPMRRALTRRLRVRDDGSGKSREEDCTFEEFDNADAIVILGDPGMGKTTFLTDISNGRCVTARTFLISPNTSSGETIFLDALDEYRTVASGQDTILEVAKALVTLNKPKFRLSCRAADWFGSTDQEVIKNASISGRVVVLELCPLSPSEIIDAVTGKVTDPESFHEYIESQGLGNLLGNPQTLELFATAWGASDRPKNKFEAYDLGISEILKEINNHHVTRSPASHTLHELREAAGAVASILILSNSLGICRTDSTVGQGYIKTEVVSGIKDEILHAVLRRRLFVSHQTDRFELIHRTVAEFLAAQHLSRLIHSGLPIKRVMALICGFDGKPISSLRGLYAWLMCMILDQAADYVGRDPYGVAVYGDTSVLPPSAQCAIWVSLRDIADPWFFTNYSNSGLFRELANIHTARIINSFLSEPNTKVHLKIAALEAVANSTQQVIQHKIARDLVLDNHDNKWLRGAALRAYANMVHHNWPDLDALDHELAQKDDDLTSLEVRADLLSMTLENGNVPHRLLSICKQVASTKDRRYHFGQLYRLIFLPLDSDLEAVLDGVSEVLIDEDNFRLLLQPIFAGWLRRRLKCVKPISSTQLSNWLQSLRMCDDQFSANALDALKERFECDNGLFEEVYSSFANSPLIVGESFKLFILDHIHSLLPAEVWPVPYPDFLLSRAENEYDPDRAAALFQGYLCYFPKAGASAALSDRGFDYLKHRTDVANAIGDWNRCEINQWRLDRWEKDREQLLAAERTRSENITFLTPRLIAIKGGTDDYILKRATRFLVSHSSPQGVCDLRERLVLHFNQEIATALMDGIVKYVESDKIPTKDAVIECWRNREVEYSVYLLSLSTLLRFQSGQRVPTQALPQCIAAVIATNHIGLDVSTWDSFKAEWLKQQVVQAPDLLKSILSVFWSNSAFIPVKPLVAFRELSEDHRCHGFLSSFSIDFLTSEMQLESWVVRELLPVFMSSNPDAALDIAKIRIEQQDLPSQVRVVWSTVLFLIEHETFLEQWKSLMIESHDNAWEGIDLIRGINCLNTGPVELTIVQNVEVISLVGRQFPNSGYPLSNSYETIEWNGSRNLWDASEFVHNQIQLLAADVSPDVLRQFERLVNDDGLISYYDVIKHHKARHEQQRRDLEFSFELPHKVAEAVMNRAPATPFDLLEFIVDHLNDLAREMTGTQKERYRAYWNEEGRSLHRPKREEVCSGFLAWDLQCRVRLQGLIITVEHHMVADKECDLVVLQGTERLLPIEVKHHYNPNLWNAWHTQLDKLYLRDPMSNGLGIYLVLWSGEATGRRMPTLPEGMVRPSNATELKSALDILIPEVDRHRLRVVVVDISEP